MQGTRPGRGEVKEGRVARLSEALSNQIAAGEVVERPASAVKELVENSIDAGATRVRVELEEGGLALLRVSDNGCGMFPGDAALCVERHATSKIRTVDDLHRIGTLGFRGEALPSIASVSRFELVTKPHGELGGTRVLIDGGGPARVEETGAAPGTEITVRDLFFNTPARLKFLKSRSTELKHVIEAMQRVAVPNPGIGLALVHNGRTVFDLPAVTDPIDRLRAVLGDEDGGALFATEPAEADGVRAHGFAAPPTVSRRNSTGLQTFVNGRFVRDKTLHSALRIAYQGLIDPGRYPVAVVFLQVPPEALDVNVHPMKIEVRFRAPDSAFRAVRRSVATMLASSPWLREPQPAPARVTRAAGAPVPDSSELDTLELDEWASGPLAPPPDLATGERNAWGARVVVDAGASPQAPSRAYRLHPAPGAGGFGSGAGGAPSFGGARPAGAGTGSGFAAGSQVHAVSEGGAPGEAALGNGYFSRLHFIGQLRATYLLATDGDGLVVVDQHAAHERITFERLRQAARGMEPPVQPLLVPRVVTLDPLRAATLDAELPFFRALGFEIDPFGKSDFAIRALPVWISPARADALLRDALDDLAESGHSARFDEARDAVMSRIACHASVRAGDSVTRTEAEALFRDMDVIDFGAHCPHGRPVHFRLTAAEIETRFARR